MFTTALIAGDAVILDAIFKAGLQDKIPIVFVDTFTLFPESIAHIREVENHYGFKSVVYHAAGCTDQQDYYTKYGRDYWMKDIDKYDMLCKVLPKQLHTSTITYHLALLTYSTIYQCVGGAYESCPKGAEQ